MKEQSTQTHSFLSSHWEEEHLYLKCRSLWLLAGDKNYAFFHRKCIARISQNHISKINSSDGEVIKGHSQIQQVSHSHFQLLFTEDDVTDNAMSAEFLSNIPSLVTADLNVGLVKPFSKKRNCGRCLGHGAG